MTSKPLLALALGALGLFASSAGAHEMFLKPAKFHLEPGAKTAVALFNGTIDKSENPITRDRMKAVSVAAGGKISAPPATQWRDDQVTSYLDLTVAAPGTYVVGVSTAPKIIELSADNFEEYLQHDGIEDTLKARQAEKGPRTPVRERYSKHVKTILQVGEALTDDYARPLGFPAEILLAQNPTTVKVGDTLALRTLIKDQPMAGQLVYASYEGAPNGSGHAGAAKLRTDAGGGASFKVTAAGRWYITLINMQKATGEATYESNWSTLTFEIR
ncbi:DUF4198 domain-containing protein [Phenylobacterium sp.]|uniref:DUF4198 domain-containing protein n=1 Tax=Phenylobacterium sp. TaxID=1871053 RepID=UPI003BAA5B03